LNWLIPIALMVVNAAWLVLVVLGLPGTWLMVATTLLVAWWARSANGSSAPPMFSLGVLVAIVAIAGVAEVLELGASMVGVRATGGTRRGAAGALVGGVIGAVAGTFLIPIPLLGSLIGACLGAGLGAWGLELSGGREHGAAVKAGMGAGVGRLFGTITKLAAGVVIWVVVAVAAFWP
jgi:uncharacterized protein